MPVLDYFITHEPTYKTYNVTPDAETELLHAAQLVQKLGGKNNEIRVGTAGYGLNYSGSNARLKEEIPTITLTPFEQAVQNLFNYYKQHPDIINLSLLRLDK